MGIDVALAVDLIRLATEKAMDAAIVFSSDKDLMPAIETVYDLDLCHIEVACWQGAHRLRFGGTQLPWCHNLSAADFASIEDPIDYAAR